MLWPFIVKLLKGLAPKVALNAVNPASAESAVGRFVGWILLMLVVAGVVTALNIVPLVIGDQGEKLKILGGWRYMFLASEGFALAAFVNEGLRPK